MLHREMVTKTRAQPPWATLSSPSLEAKGWNPAPWAPRLLAPARKEGWALSRMWEMSRARAETRPLFSFSCGPGWDRTWSFPGVLPSLCIPVSRAFGTISDLAVYRGIPTPTPKCSVLELLCYKQENKRLGVHAFVRMAVNPGLHFCWRLEPRWSGGQRSP